MMNGASPGPAPAAQARASNSRLARSSWRTWPHRKLRRKVPKVDGALTTQPMAPAVPPVRNTSASSMQTPPASADATRVIILSPVFARPGARPRSRWLWTSSGRPRRRARVAQPGIGHQAVIVEGADLGVVASIGCSFSGVGFLFRSTAPSYRFRTLPTPSFGGFGVRSPLSSPRPATCPTPGWWPAPPRSPSAQGPPPGSCTPAGSPGRRGEHSAGLRVGEVALGLIHRLAGILLALSLCLQCRHRLAARPRIILWSCRQDKASQTLMSSQ